MDESKLFKPDTIDDESRKTPDKAEESPTGSNEDIPAISEAEQAEVREHDMEKLAAARNNLEGIGQRIESAQDSFSRPKADEIISGKDGQEIHTYYTPKEDLAPHFGEQSGRTVRVREDLSPRVKRFVRQHEIEHIYDKGGWGGDIGEEIRVNLRAGLKDPIGLAATVYATLRDKERREFYWDRYIRRKI